VSGCCWQQDDARNRPLLPGGNGTWLRRSGVPCRPGRARTVVYLLCSQRILKLLSAVAVSPPGQGATFVALQGAPMDHGRGVKRLWPATSATRPHREPRWLAYVSPSRRRRNSEPSRTVHTFRSSQRSPCDPAYQYGVRGRPRVAPGRVHERLELRDALSRHELGWGPSLNLHHSILRWRQGRHDGQTVLGGRLAGTRGSQPP